MVMFPPLKPHTFRALQEIAAEELYVYSLLQNFIALKGNQKGLAVARNKKHAELFC